MAWVQTWLSREQRRDRAVFRLTGVDRNLHVRVPLDVQDVSVAVNGQRRLAKTTADAFADSAVEVDLSDIEATSGEYLVELSYAFSSGRPAMGTMRIELPRIAGDTRTGQIFWQLITPPDEFLLRNPPSVTPEFNWGWQMFFSRSTNETTRRFEQELSTFDRQFDRSSVGASQYATNQYLFSSWSQLPAAVTVRTASRSAILLVAGGASLLIGFLLMTIRRLRHPVLLVLVAFATLLVGQRFPETAILVAQAACLGIALVLAVRCLQWIFVCRRRYDGVIHGTTSPSSIDHLSVGSGRASGLHQGSRIVSTVTATTPSSVSEHRM
jgi:hypothetical protein